MDDAPMVISFERWYEHEQPRVLAALTLMAGDAEVAAEVTSEAFAIAYERWTRVLTMASPGGWLQRVAVNAMRRRLRRAAAERALLRSEPRSVPPPNLAVEVWTAVAQLPTQQRTAIALRYLLDLTQAEIAELMGIAPGTAAATLSAARKRLAPLLDPSDADVETTHA
jgi:RNA polymerase sigma-70 factor (ECF subfamily)